MTKEAVGGEHRKQAERPASTARAKTTKLALVVAKDALSLISLCKL